MPLSSDTYIYDTYSGLSILVPFTVVSFLKAASYIAQVGLEKLIFCRRAEGSCNLCMQRESHLSTFGNVAFPKLATHHRVESQV